MSDAEKAAQIGEMVLLLEQQKRELAHLTEKIDKVKHAYNTFGSTIARWHVDATTGHIFHISGSGVERELYLSLLSHEELAKLVTEFEDAESNLRRTREKLANFGVTGF